MFKGIYTALITPFKDSKTDFDALGVLIDRQIKAGAEGFVLLGTTAETPALSFEEKKEILDFACAHIGKRAKIIIGAGANNTQTTLKNIELASRYNPDGLLIVTPYYNKPNLNGMIKHFSLAAEAGKPLILYHIPGRTGQKLSQDFLANLLEAVPQIKAIKESDYDINHITQTAVKFGADRIDYICGNDDLWPVFLGLGSRCLITAAGNTMAPAMVKIYKLFEQGQTTQAMDVFRKAWPVITGSFIEVNPTCPKYLLNKLGLCSAEVRLPLGELTQKTKETLDEIFETYPKEFFI